MPDVTRVGLEVAREWVTLIFESRGGRRNEPEPEPALADVVADLPATSDADRVRSAVNSLARESVFVFVGIALVVGFSVLAVYMILNPDVDKAGFPVRESWEALRQVRGELHTEGILSLSFVVFVPAFLVFVVDGIGIASGNESIRAQARREHVDRIFFIALSLAAGCAMIHAVPAAGRRVDLVDVPTGTFVAAACCALLPLYGPTTAIRDDMIKSARRERQVFMLAKSRFREELQATPRLADLVGRSGMHRLIVGGFTHLTVGLVAGLVFAVAGVFGGFWSLALCGYVAVFSAVLGGTKIRREQLRRNAAMDLPNARFTAWPDTILSWFMWATVVIIGLTLLLNGAFLGAVVWSAPVGVGWVFSVCISDQRVAALLDLEHVEGALQAIDRRLRRLENE